MKKITFILFLFATVVANAQNFSLSGRVIDENQEVLPGASVLIKEVNKGTYTDFEGKYAVEIPQGNYTIQVSYLGYKKVSKTIEVKGNVVLDFALLETNGTVLDEVFVSAVRVNADAPITHSNLSKSQIEERNLGQDIPTQLNFLPNITTTSDAGAGIGYTGFRVRGTGNEGINVTINGIPFNDAESGGSFFVNLQDFTSSVKNLQLQRGVGTSTNGSGAFGASLNILTDGISEEAYASTSNSFGSFNTRRHNVKFSTGMITDAEKGRAIEFSGRLSQIKSDGFIDRASSDLKSYFLQGTYRDDNTLIKLIHFAGHEVTYQSWFGFEAGVNAFIGESTEIFENPTFNIAGIRFDENGNQTGFYENQVDNYKQDHFQIHWNQKYNEKWSSNLSLNYTDGRGFFEEYIDDWYTQNWLFTDESSLSFYGLPDVNIGGETITNSDIVRRRWLDNDFYVINANINYKDNKWNFNSGVFWSQYSGEHFGEVIWARFASDSELGDQYYFGTGHKSEFSLFTKATYKINSQLSVYGDLQGRFLNYQTDGQTLTTDTLVLDEQFNFFNPKAGLSYILNKKNQFYVSYARANREPNRTDFESGPKKSESLDDYELGWRFRSANSIVNINGYYMKYKNQLVNSGRLNNVGAVIRENVEDSYRLGLEIDAKFNITDKFNIQPNVAISRNRIDNYSVELNGESVAFQNTDISFSPSLVANNIIEYKAVNGLSFQLLSKFVGEQFLNNVNSNASRLNSYFISDLNINYSVDNVLLFKNVTFNILVNNIFNKQFISNGYFFYFDDTFTNPGQTTTFEGAGFYPQAGINFLVGATLRF